MKIIQEHRSKLHDPEFNIIPLQQLIPAFARLERQSHEMTGNNSPLIQQFAIDQTADGFFKYVCSDPQPIPCFSSLDEAWLGLHQRWHAMIAFTGPLHQDWFNHLGDVHRTFRPEYRGGTQEQHRLEVECDLHLWTLAFEEFKSKMITTTTREASILALLEIFALQAETILRTSSAPNSAMLWDNFLPQFQRSIRLCRMVIENEVVESGASMPTSSVPIVIRHRYTPEYLKKDTYSPLTFDLSVSMALLHIITKCRDARIRLEAIKLLEDYPRLEGLWDGSIIAQIGRLIDSSERSCASLEDAAHRGALAAEISLSQRVLHVRGEPSIGGRGGSLHLLTAAGERTADILTITRKFDW